MNLPYIRMMAVKYLHLRPGDLLPELPKDPFRAVLISEVKVNSSWRDSVADWLVASGCLYFIAWGIDCEIWHDCVDTASFECFDYGDIPDDCFVMTTWHEKDTLAEAMWFARQCARHPEVRLKQTLLLHIAAEAEESAILKAYFEGQKLPDED